MQSLSGNYTDWEFLHRPTFDLRGVRKWFRLKSWAPLYERPRIRPRGQFVYRTRNAETIVITPDEVIDGFTIPLSLAIATFGRINSIMADILWVAAVHDKACRLQMNNAMWRAQLFQECIYFGTHRVIRGKGVVARGERWIRAWVLQAGVHIGSAFGAC